MKLFKLTILVSCMSVALSAYADEPRNWQESWYIGGAVGKSKLHPDVGTTDWRVTDDKSASKKLYTGVNLTRDVGIEAFWNDLGDAKLNGAGKSGGVDYKAVGAAAVYKPVINIGGIRPLGKIGVAKLTTKDKGELTSKQLNDIDLFLGVGAEYALTNNVNVRAEYERYDKDIQQYNLGLNWRPLQRQRNNRVENIIVKEPTPVRVYTPKLRPKPVYIPAPRPKPVVQKPRYVPPVVQKPKYVPPKPQTKVIRSSLSGGSNFNTGSSELTSRGKNELNRIASEMQSDNMKVENIHIIGHTDNVGSNKSNMALSLARANSVANYLQNLGINRYLMRMNGLGESRPIASNKTSNGRTQNRRVEINIKGVKTMVVRSR